MGRLAQQVIPTLSGGITQGPATRRVWSGIFLPQWRYRTKHRKTHTLGSDFVESGMFLGHKKIVRQEFLGILGGVQKQIKLEAGLISLSSIFRLVPSPFPLSGCIYYKRMYTGKYLALPEGAFMKWFLETSANALVRSHP